MSFHPQTPQSPSQLSPNSTDPLSSMNTSMASIPSTLPTPAHSVNGASNMAHDGSSTDESPQKRKRALDDLGDREQKKVHIEDHRLGIEALHENVGEKYLLCRSQHKRTIPQITEDMFEAFDLTGIALEVARTLPNGEKNAIRKTYKGHIKKLGVNGHFDSVKKDPKSPNHLLRLVGEPEDSWLARQVKSKEIEWGLSSETLSKLQSAMTMARGPIPKSEWDSSVLGDLAADKVSAGGKPLSAKGTAPNTPLHPSVARPKGQQQPLAAAAAAAAAAAQDAARPRRSIKKRSYGDSSFEGYGEGFPDDDGGVDTGYSTGEGEGGGAGQKRRKKNPGPAQFAAAAAGGGGGGPVRQYGPGMVGA